MHGLNNKDMKLNENEKRSLISFLENNKLSYSEAYREDILVGSVEIILVKNNGDFVIEIEKMAYDMGFILTDRFGDNEMRYTEFPTAEQLNEYYRNLE